VVLPAELHTDLCSQGHGKVGKAEESSRELPEASYLEAIPGREKEAAGWEAAEG